MPGVRMLQPRRPSSVARRRSAPVSIRPDAAQLAEARQRDVGGDRQEQHEALGAPLARDVADAAGRPHRPASPSATSLPADREPAGIVRGEAGEGPAQLLAARADHAGDAQDLAGVQLEADVAVGAAPSASPSASSTTSSPNGRCSGSR